MQFKRNSKTESSLLQANKVGVAILFKSPPSLGEGLGGGFYKQYKVFNSPPPSLPQRGRNSITIRIPLSAVTAT